MNIAQQMARECATSFAQSFVGVACGGDPEQMTNEQNVEGVHQLDPWADEVIQRAARPLAGVISTIHLNLGIERFVIYGGFGLALGEPYRRKLVAFASGGTWNVGQDWNSMIELGATDGDSGLIGAGRAAAFLRARRDVIRS